MRRTLLAWLFGGKDPAWPIRCGRRFCRDAAYQSKPTPRGRVWLCDDCAAHAEAVALAGVS